MASTFFGVRHTLRYYKGGLVIARHKKACEKPLYLSRRAFTSEDVRAEPLIRQGHNKSERETRQGSEKFETQGDVIIWAYGVNRLMPSSMSNSATMTKIPTSLSKWRRSWLGGKK